MTVSSFHEMTEFVKNKNLTDDYYTLISLRFIELLHFFDYTDFEFNNIDRKHPNNDCQLNFASISKSMFDTISTEIFRFMVLEAALLTQVEWIYSYQLQKCKDEINLQSPLHTIYFRSLTKPTILQMEKSNYKYLDNSIFSFPPASKDKDCGLLVNVILKNIKDIERKAFF